MDPIRKRGIIKAKLTSFEKYVTPLFEMVQSNQDISELETIALEERLTRANLFLEEFESIQYDIESNLTNENELEEHQKEREAFENRFYSIISKAKKSISDSAHHNNSIPSQNSGSQRSNSVASPGREHQNSNFVNIKLQAIELPRFDGSYQTWLEFRDLFESLIHNNAMLDDIQKYHYLRSSLADSAAQVIKSLNFTSVNYAVAWDILCQRYDNKRLLIQNHVKSLFEIESIQKESSRKIRNLIDVFSKHLLSLQQLKQPIENWDTLLIFMITSKLDANTVREWETYKATNEVPNLNDLKLFLKSRADLLETIEMSHHKSGKQEGKHAQGSASTKSFLSNVVSCIVCKGEHELKNCSEFLKQTSSNRFETVKKSRLCTNCFKSGHWYKNCRMPGCNQCKKKHNVLLHPDHEKTQESASHITNKKESDNVVLTSVNTCQKVILSTALVTVFDSQNKAHTARALLDCGAQSSFIDAEFCKELGLKQERIEFQVTGINNTVSNLKHRCKIKLKSLFAKFSADINCLVIPKITGLVPSSTIQIKDLQIPKNIQLADPAFHTPQPVQILIGADLFWEILGNEQIKLGPKKPILQETKLGFVISGPIHLNENNSVHCHFSKNLEVQNQLTKFWEIEESYSLSKKLYSTEELDCEKLFVETTKQNSEGRFVVELPLKNPVECLGDSYDQAKTRFLNLEKRLNSNHELKALYVQFMDEYERLGHMKEVEASGDNKGTYYMPHHGVLRESSITTKLRVVFDCSAVTTSKVSLNNILMTGPVLQNDIFSILLRFRKYAFVIGGDIEKMYRQVQVSEGHTKLQRILWRKNPCDPIRTYELLTVTYGMNPSSFLSIRCLHELAKNCKDNKIANVILNDFYVDDMVSGADNIDEASYICKGVADVLKQGCFNLRKLYSNDSRVLEHISDKEISSNTVQFENENAKTLGLCWSPQSDRMMFQVSCNTRFTEQNTKRVMLSIIAQIYDPLGLISPCITTAKVLLQKLWLEKLAWDDVLPETLNSQFVKFQNNLIHVNNIKIARHITCPNPIQIELHGFCDSSQSAYGACVYIRSTDSNGKIFNNLLCSKGKVAPVKSVSLPRLELMGALVLARLVNKVIQSWNVPFENCYLWTDSSIVLCWLKMVPNTLKTFISHRVAEIQELTGNHFWRHVPSKENPADILSRGMDPTVIANCDLWWYGPEFLKHPISGWPNATFKNLKNVPEVRNNMKTLLVASSNNPFPFTRFSKLLRLKRCTAYLCRFMKNCQVPKEKRAIGPLSVLEIEEAFTKLIKCCQSEAFFMEIQALSSRQSISKKSKILNLNPFIDPQGILRVGGRLENSALPFDKKYPVILPSKHHLTKLLFDYEHLNLGHAGPQHLLATVRENFWPMSGRNIARRTVHLCVKCFRQNPKTISPIMGNLPVQRVQPSPVFSCTGLDYAGPFLIKEKKFRNTKLVKSWICIFICLSTKAIHIEVVTDLSKDTFLLALKRFVGRRGKPTQIMSDNGTNFIAARSELEQLGKFLNSIETDLKDSLSRDNITWSFIPPYTPHFGGLWEAGVRTIKHHLKRVLGQAHLTYEEFSSVLVQIEAIINSRPLYPLSSEPGDLTPLTPAHFLIGKPLTALPEASFLEVPINRLARYRLVQKLSQHIWERWSKEYLSELQKRTKWLSSRGEIPIGSMVVVKEDQLPPMKWKLGRVVSAVSGKDGVCRVFKVRTTTGVITRAFSKLCPLPIPESD